MPEQMVIKITFTPEDEYNFGVSVDLTGSNPHQTEVETLTFARLMLSQHINLLLQGIRRQSRSVSILPPKTDTKKLIAYVKGKKAKKSLPPLRTRLKL